ncbi:hypothetical protein A2U01_0042913, partial [Trifolium medium]|nr:hypothetical protein [Trifolium medium]
METNCGIFAAEGDVWWCHNAGIGATTDQRISEIDPTSEQHD